MNGFDLSTISGLYVGSTEYTSIYKGSTLIWTKSGPTPIDYSREYFTIESLEDNNTISIIGALGSGQPASSSYDTVAVWYYSTDKTNWTQFNVRNSTQLYNPDFITLNKNQKVYLKTTSHFYKTGITNTQGRTTYQYNYFDSTKNIKVYGNIMSICYGDNFRNQTFLASGYTFHSLFKNCITLVDISNLILPATRLQSCCYMNMFYGCSSLTTAPSILPATTLAIDCYRSMFDRCTSLTTAPELPATTLAPNCYRSMFFNCTSLRTAPDLPATALAQNCYYSMFNGCSLLHYVKALFLSDISSTTSYTYKWLYNVAATGTFVKSKDATWSRTDASGIPDGWTVTII